MKEDRLALQKAVDSGDTDLGICDCASSGLYARLHVFSLSCIATVIHSPALGSVLPSNRGWWFEPCASEPVAASICEGTEPRNASRFLLFGR